MKVKLNLYTIRTFFFGLGLDLFNIFGVIGLYTLYDNNIFAGIAPYVCVHFGYATLLPFFARIGGRLGTKRSTILGSVVFLMSYLALVLSNKETVLPIVIWIVLNILGHLLIFVPHHYYMTRYTSARSRGHEIGKFRAVMLLFALILPAIGAVASNWLGLAGIAIFSSIFVFFSLLPLIWIDDFHYHYSGKLLHYLDISGVRKNIKLVGINELQGRFDKYWFIYVFLIAGQSFTVFGEILTLVNVINIFAALLLGNFLDHHNRKKMLKFEGFFVSISWLARAIARTPLMIVIADSLFKVNENIKDSAYSILTYDLMTERNQTAQLDEKIVIREIAINYAISLTLVLGFILVYILGFNVTFVFAALAALLFTLL